MSAPRWLVVGLGNPGPDYAATRHNAGYETVDLLAGRVGGRFRAHRGRAAVLEGRVGALPGVPVVLAKPTCFMNLSGGPVAALRDYYRVPVERLVVVHDDLDLAFGAVRLKRGGGSGGHNGLRSVTQSLGTPEYLRVRLGIGRPPGRQDPAEFVLRPFTTAERRDWPFVVDRAADAVEALLEDGLEAAQNAFHADPG